MEILARLNYEKLDHTRDNVAHLVVSLKAPTLDWVQKRPSLCVLPLVDLSGSMQGAKLTYAKKSLLKLIDHLQEGDVAGLVAFESHVHVLVPPQEVTSEFKHVLRKAVDKMQVMGGTNFSEGLLKAIDVVHRLDLSPKYIKRIIMFTDGEPTEGITIPGQILRMMEQRRGSVTVSAFGYGNSHGGLTSGCDLQFLTKLSEEGHGNFAYVKDPDDALAAFGKELGGLLSTYATNLSIDVEPVNGHSITKVITNIETQQDGLGEHSMSIPDILSEEVRHFVFEVKVAEQNKSFPRPVTLFNASVTYNILTEDGRQESRSCEAKCRVHLVRASDADKAPIREVDEIASLHKMVRAQLEAEELAKKGHYSQATMMMQGIALEAKTNGYVHVASAASEIGTRLGSQVLYTQNQGFLRSVANVGTRAYGVSGVDEEAMVYMTDCGVVGSNAVMDSMMTAFVGGHESAEAPAVIPPTNLVPSGAPSMVDLLAPSTMGIVPSTSTVDLQTGWADPSHLVLSGNPSSLIPETLTPEALASLLGIPPVDSGDVK